LAGDAWLDRLSGKIIYVVVGVDPNTEGEKSAMAGESIVSPQDAIDAWMAAASYSYSANVGDLSAFYTPGLDDVIEVRANVFHIKNRYRDAPGYIPPDAICTFPDDRPYDRWIVKLGNGETIEMSHDARGFMLEQKFPASRPGVYVYDFPNDVIYDSPDDVAPDLDMDVWGELFQ